MAPEVLRAEAATYSSDVFSLGIVVWECVSQQRPYYDISRGSFGRELEEHIKKGGRPVIPASVDPALGKILLQTWVEDAAMRPAAAEVLAVSEAILCALPDPQRWPRS